MEISNPESAITVAHDQNLIGFWDWDISAKRKYLSPVFKSMLGYEDQEISNTPESWMNLILKEDQQAVISAYQKHVSSKGNYPYEVKARYRHKNGSIVYILSKGKITEWDYMGNPVRMIGYYTDVTSIVKEYSGIEEKYDQFKTVVELINAGIWTIDTRTGKNYWSENFYNETGFTPAEIAPSYFNLLHLLTHPDDITRLVESINAQIKTKEPQQVSVRLMNKSGAYNWYETAGKLAYDADNNLTKITGYFIKQKSAPSPVETIVSPIKTEEETGVSIQEPVQRGEWSYDLNRARFTFSKEVLDMLGLPENAPLKFEPINRMFTQESQDIFQKGFNTAVYNKGHYDLTLVCETPDGSIKTIREKGGPVIDETGKVIALQGTMELISEEKNKRPESPEEIQAIADQNQRLLNFAHIASHNLRSHASNLQMTLQVMHSAQSEEEKKFFMDSIEKISTAFTQSINNLNELLLIETESSKAKVSLNFNDVFATIRSALGEQIRASKAVVEADFSKCPSIDYIPAYLESIILNLVSNALKYKHPERLPHISLETFIKEGQKVLMVSDNGVGIDLKKYQNKLFKMHQTFHSHPDSRGIGLLITKNQVEAMGGTISVESEPGVGTTFTIVF